MVEQSIRQAVFTSARSGQIDGYHLVGASAELDQRTRKRIAQWGPAHDSLIDPRPGAVSINFHGLEGCEAFCVSKTTAVGAEYSGRGGCAVYTQCLVLSAETLARFANNAFAVYEAALAAGRFATSSPPPTAPPAFSLPGGANVLNTWLAGRQLREAGPERIAAALQALQFASTLAVAGADTKRLFAAIVNLTPVDARPDLSFSTGLKFSPARPFRLTALSSDPREAARTGRQTGVATLDLQSAPPPLAGHDPWPQQAVELCRDQRWDELRRRLLATTERTQTPAS